MLKNLFNKFFRKEKNYPAEKLPFLLKGLDAESRLLISCFTNKRMQYELAEILIRSHTIREEIFVYGICVDSFEIDAKALGKYMSVINEKLEREYKAYIHAVDQKTSLYDERKISSHRMKEEPAPPIRSEEISALKLSHANPVNIVSETLLSLSQAARVLFWTALAQLDTRGEKYISLLEEAKFLHDRTPGKTAQELFESELFDAGEQADFSVRFRTDLQAAYTEAELWHDNLKRLYRFFFVRPQPIVKKR